MVVQITITAFLLRHRHRQVRVACLVRAQVHLTTVAPVAAAGMAVEQQEVRRQYHLVLVVATVTEARAARATFIHLLHQETIRADVCSTAIIT